MVGWGDTQSRLIAFWGPQVQFLNYEQGTHFAKGSMEPKIRAIVRFLEQGGKEAIVTNPENIGRALKGETGTRIVL